MKHIELALEWLAEWRVGTDGSRPLLRPDIGSMPVSMSERAMTAAV